MKAVSEIRKEQDREARGAKTRQDILQAAVHVASAEGLEGLTIGRLADELRMSKSGLFAHFGSKEELQLAVVSKARDIFVREVVDPAFKRDRGLGRLLAMLDEWLAYVGRSVFRGGCFFMASAIEFDSRPGKVRDLIAGLSRSWLDALETEARYAQALGQLDPHVDTAQLAFELHALVHGANWYYNLFEDKRAFERARTGILDRLRHGATPGLLRLLGEKSAARMKTISKKTKRKESR
ncbi:MAG TPA: TetR/AcrR family transcriptional regulator [Blastocatellia bacterium]|nr:TetR/AcrR family transcriptional regulator [Blastocatellia bacterium]